MQEVGCCLELGSGCSQVASAKANENTFFCRLLADLERLEVNLKGDIDTKTPSTKVCMIYSKRSITFSKPRLLLVTFQILISLGI